MRRVVTAPPGSEIGVFDRTGSDEEGLPTEVRFTDDPRAPVFGKLHPDRTHPYRQTELVDEVNKRLPGKRSINAYDIQCVRAVHGIDANARPDFAHKPKFGSQQYSDAFADWLASQDQSFFDDARDRYVGL